MQFEIRDFHVPLVDKNNKILRDNMGKPIPATRDQLNLMMNGMLIGYILKIPKVFSSLYYQPPEIERIILGHIEENMGSTGWRFANKPIPEESQLDVIADDDDFETQEEDE